jgi:hypothetical protein
MRTKCFIIMNIALILGNLRSIISLCPAIREWLHIYRNAPRQNPLTADPVTVGLSISPYG